jgi:hypothetical protein
MRGRGMGRRGSGGPFPGSGRQESKPDNN